LGSEAGAQSRLLYHKYLVVNILCISNCWLKRPLNVRRHAHLPYSKFSVVAARLTKSGKIVAGCNVVAEANPTC